MSVHPNTNPHKPHTKTPKQGRKREKKICLSPRAVRSWQKCAPHRTAARALQASGGLCFARPLWRRAAGARVGLEQCGLRRRVAHEQGSTGACAARLGGTAVARSTRFRAGGRGARGARRRARVSGRAARAHRLARTCSTHARVARDASYLLVPRLLRCAHGQRSGTAKSAACAAHRALASLAAAGAPQKQQAFFCFFLVFLFFVSVFVSQFPCTATRLALKQVTRPRPLLHEWVVVGWYLLCKARFGTFFQVLNAGTSDKSRMMNRPINQLFPHHSTIRS
jgi:hypothetical protein